jgi:hypothetical protein
MGSPSLLQSASGGCGEPGGSFFQCDSKCLQFVGESLADIGGGIADSTQLNSNGLTDVLGFVGSLGPRLVGRPSCHPRVHPEGVVRRGGPFLKCIS